MISAKELEKLLKVLKDSGATGFRFSSGPPDAKEEIEVALTPSTDLKEAEKDLDVRSPTIGFRTITFDDKEDND
jgi:hypothetical protein